MKEKSRNLWLHSFRTLAAIAIAAAVILGILSGYSHLHWNRSLAATIYCRQLEANRQTVTQEQEEQNLAQLRQDDPQQPETPVPADSHFDEEFAVQTFDGMTTFYLNSENHSNISFIYFHGDGLTDGLNEQDWAYINQLANKFDAEIVVPDYPRVPWHIWEDFCDKLTEWYVPWEYGNDSRRIIFIGNSAGGSLALDLAAYFRDQDVKNPEMVIAFSPITDFTMSNPGIDALEAGDYVLDRGKITADGAAYSLPNPLDNSLGDLPRTILYAGDQEILLPDIQAYAEKMQQADGDVTLRIGRNLPHGYETAPIPERDAILDELYGDIVTEEN